MNVQKTNRNILSLLLFDSSQIVLIILNLFIYIMRNVLNSINILDLISAQPKKLSSRNSQAWQRGKEKYGNKEIKNRGREVYFCYLNEMCDYIS